MSGVHFIIPARTEHIALSLAAPMEIFADFSKNRLINAVLFCIILLDFCCRIWW